MSDDQDELQEVIAKAKQMTDVVDKMTQALMDAIHHGDTEEKKKRMEATVVAVTEVLFKDPDQGGITRPMWESHVGIAVCMAMIADMMLDGKAIPRAVTVNVLARLAHSFCTDADGVRGKVPKASMN